MADASTTSRSAKVQRTQWTAQFLAAAELVRNGYVVSFTMGNSTPLADLMVARQDGSPPFWVDVKGLGADGAWLIRRRPAVTENLYYVLVRVGRTRGDDRFFVLSHRQVGDLIAAQDEIDRAKGLRDIGGGFPWRGAAPHENAWTILPGWSGGDTAGA
jgi:hypothetical protein